MNLSQTGRALLLSGGFLALFSFVSPDTPTRPTSTEGAHRFAKRKLMADKKASTITYAMRHPMHAWEGVCRDVNGAIVYDDVLEGIKYPNVTFASQQVQDDGSGKLTVTGRLTFHGVTRAVTVPVVRKESGGMTVYEGSFVTKLTDHQIEKPSLMMVPVEDELKIKFSLAFRM
jgi:polyisoprenoid-binding protein YceI